MWTNTFLLTDRHDKKLYIYRFNYTLYECVGCCDNIVKMQNKVKTHLWLSVGRKKTSCHICSQPSKCRLPNRLLWFSWSSMWWLDSSCWTCTFAWDSFHQPANCTWWAMHQLLCMAIPNRILLSESYRQYVALRLVLCTLDCTAVVWKQCRFLDTWNLQSK